jgi:glycosyltransferase involved in cell wall biosynthesis
VTLFASGDSLTLAKLKSVHPRALRLDPSVKEGAIYEMLSLGSVYENADQFDIIHSHVGCAALPYAPLVKTPTVHTLHGIFTPDNEKLFNHARFQPYISISAAQREPRVGLNYVATVYNGIDTDRFAFYPKPEEPPYLAFLGRISPEKGTHLAIEIARRSGWRLKMAGKVDSVDQAYFEAQILPYIDGKQIEYLGEANHDQKCVILGGAVATLFPIGWREPFGLVMIESMVVGAPIIAIAMGSVPEVIVNGKTDWLCDSIEDCIAAIDKVQQLDRYTCREHVLRNFTAQHMVDGYEAIYDEILVKSFEQNSHSTTLVSSKML